MRRQEGGAGKRERECRCHGSPRSEMNISTSSSRVWREPRIMQPARFAGRPSRSTIAETLLTSRSTITGSLLAVENARALDAHPRLEAHARVVDQRAQAAEADVHHRGVEGERHRRASRSAARPSPAALGAGARACRRRRSGERLADDLRRRPSTGPAASRIRSRAACARALACSRRTSSSDRTPRAIRAATCGLSAFSASTWSARKP